MTSVMSVETPISHLDSYSDRVLIDPWPTYGELQDAQLDASVIIKI